MGEEINNDERILVFDEVKGFRDLLVFLENWHSFENPDAYDFNGIMYMFMACLNNIKKYSLESELENIQEFFEPEEKEFFLKIAKLLESSK